MYYLKKKIGALNIFEDPEPSTSNHVEVTCVAISRAAIEMQIRANTEHRTQGGIEAVSNSDVGAESH